MFSHIFQTLFPKHCFICKADVVDTTLCLACYQSVEREYNYCEYCSDQLSGGSCISCQLNIETHDIDRYIIGYHYQNAMREAIIRLKFNRQMYMVRAIEELMTPVLDEYKDILSKVDYILPMPIDRIRLSGRGFNHMLEVATFLQKMINKPILYNKLHKTAFSIPQSQLSKQERASNVKNSFKCDPVSGHILLLDDVLTTGATLKYASNTLKHAGARYITTVVLAKV